MSLNCYFVIVEVDVGPNVQDEEKDVKEKTYINLYFFFNKKYFLIRSQGMYKENLA
jgi:hypothetical protein